MLISTLPIAAMVGDVNIYMNDSDDMQIAEIEIMIAEHKRYLPYNTKEHVIVFINLMSSVHLWTSYLVTCYLDIFVERSNKFLQLIC